MLITFNTIIACCAAGCKKESGTGEEGPSEELPVNPNTPATNIPDEFVGTWFASDNDGPLSKNWEEGSFQGEPGFKDFRTMVLTKDGKNAIEYTTEVYITNDKIQQFIYKITGTLEYTAQATLTFHAQSGRMRVFSNQYSGYKESEITAADIRSYISVLKETSAGTQLLNAKRFDGANQWSVKYTKVGTATNPGNNGADYSIPPATGTHVRIENSYFPTVTIGTQEWMSVNYKGSGGITLPNKTVYGTFYRFNDVTKIAVPAGWRIPTKADFLKLLKSQNVAYDDIFNTTDGADLKTKKALGNLMATTGWLKQDGYASNTTGFTALPANIQVQSGNPYGEGTNLVLWTADKDGNNNPLTFKILQMPTDTYATFQPFLDGYNPVYIPVRFVKDK